MRSTPASPSAAASGTASADASSILNELSNTLRDTAEAVVPWFLSQMPTMYFQDTDRASQLSHLRAIIAAKASNRPLEMTLRSEDNRQWTMLRPGNQPGVLAELVGSLPNDLSLRAAKIHSSRDGQLVLDTFEFGEQLPFDPSDPRQADKVKATIAYAANNAADWTKEEIETFFRNCTQDYTLTLTPLRICKHNALFRKVSGTDSSALELEPESDPTVSRVTFAFANARTRTMLERVARIFGGHRISINRAYLDVIKDPPHGSVTLLGFVIQSPQGTAIDPKGDFWKRVSKDLLRMKWVDENDLALAERHVGLDVARAEAIMGLAHLSHQVLCPSNPYAYTHDRIHTAVEESLPVALAIVDLFLARFDPTGKALDDTTFATRAAGLHSEIEAKVPTEPNRTILHTMLLGVEHTYRTNFFLPDRFGFALRINPKFLKNEKRPEDPYGSFFVHGRGFDGFHNRFKDIARGGLRVIRPTTAAQWAREAERLFDEVYGLSWAQQQKNKDIPEGGSKCAILVRPGEDITRCVKAFVDSMLDLITPDPATRSQVVDRFGKPEFIYLGPDENITPDHIEWIVSRAKRRKYGMPTAFMSSKPAAGINHKVYGVTSEGVNVFLEVALLARGIDPRKRPFTVKITGGPDGDVAGNMIKILNRDYGQNAKIVGIADGSGVGEDPDGLDHQELLRLFKEGLPIGSFDRKKLGKNGRVVTVEEPDGARLRNTLHNRIVSDAFVPGGGRPATIHEGNWREYLTADGKPSSPIIAEGANLFLTPEARKKLSAEGCLIIKDSSANKCGVICSSFEIDACMVLSEEEFLKIKDAYVKDVLDRLRTLARQEAMLLMSEARRHQDIALPEISTQVSKVMNGAATAIAEALPQWPKASQEIAKSLVIEHLPATLTKYAGDRIWKAIPEAYLNWLMAKRLAANIVYREGVDFFASMDAPAIAETSRRYLEKDLENQKLIDAVKKSSLADRERIVTLLERAGTRGGLLDF
ncbi:MAG: NAD-glutamate dehydrogenase [Phycisphaerae bacterium]|jgi:glutamate dehydrogenase|nr:NAD-glutamate dehydrogenase [Phycisphaerae bacterium]